jgi:hypothetical protein
MEHISIPLVTWDFYNYFRDILLLMKKSYGCMFYLFALSDETLRRIGLSFMTNLSDF